MIGEGKMVLLSRKFDPLFNGEVINRVDESIFGKYDPSEAEEKEQN